VGRVIGKGGKNIEAIRAVVKAAAIKDHQRVNVEVITEDDLRSEGGPDDPAEEAPEAAPTLAEEAPKAQEGGGEHLVTPAAAAEE